jgi:hypothetical protein
LAKELVSPVRTGTIDLGSEGVEKFPFDAFEFDNPVGANPTLRLRSPWRFALSLTIYANNAAAVAAGLPVGALYRTNSDPDTVCIVH